MQRLSSRSVRPQRGARGGENDAPHAGARGLTHHVERREDGGLDDGTRLVGPHELERARRVEDDVRRTFERATHGAWRQEIGLDDDELGLGAGRGERSQGGHAGLFTKPPNDGGHAVTSSEQLRHEVVAEVSAGPGHDHPTAGVAVEAFDGSSRDVGPARRVAGHRADARARDGDAAHERPELPSRIEDELGLAKRLSFARERRGQLGERASELREAHQLAAEETMARSVDSRELEIVGERTAGARLERHRPAHVTIGKAVDDDRAFEGGATREASWCEARAEVQGERAGDGRRREGAQRPGETLVEADREGTPLPPGFRGIVDALRRVPCQAGQRPEDGAHRAAGVLGDLAGTARDRRRRTPKRMSEAHFTPCAFCIVAPLGGPLVAGIRLFTEDATGHDVAHFAPTMRDEDGRRKAARPRTAIDVLDGADAGDARMMRVPADHGAQRGRQAQRGERAKHEARVALLLHRHQIVQVVVDEARDVWVLYVPIGEEACLQRESREEASRERSVRRDGRLDGGTGGLLRAQQKVSEPTRERLA
ncbi:hypothetical protein BH11MYX4_BH11MYX4_47140 [soil metagenome]